MTGLAGAKRPGEPAECPPTQSGTRLWGVEVPELGCSVPGIVLWSQSSPGFCLLAAGPVKFGCVFLLPKLTRGPSTKINKGGGG